MENKQAFISALETALIMYSRERIKSIKYVCRDTLEFVEIHYAGGTVQYQDITGDSCISIMKDIAHALS